jgi:hypothetical protein
MTGIVSEYSYSHMAAGAEGVAIMGMSRLQGDRLLNQKP